MSHDDQFTRWKRHLNANHRIARGMAKWCNHWGSCILPALSSSLHILPRIWSLETLLVHIFLRIRCGHVATKIEVHQYRANNRDTWTWLFVGIFPVSASWVRVRWSALISMLCMVFRTRNEYQIPTAFGRTSSEEHIGSNARAHAHTHGNRNQSSTWSANCSRELTLRDPFWLISKNYFWLISRITNERIYPFISGILMHMGVYCHRNLHYHFLKKNVHYTQK